MTKLTDKTAFSATLADGDLLHIVDVSDTTDNAAGSSYKLSLLNLLKYIFSTSNSITAYAGGGQTNATALTAFDNNVTTVATDNDSVKLLAATQHRRQRVRNNSTKDLDIYPQSGEQIDSLGVDNPYTLAAGGIIEFVCFAAGTFKST